MKVIVDIQDSEASFGLKVLKSLAFIKKAKPLSTSGVKLLDDLQNAAEEVKLHKQGKITLKSAQALLDEL